MSIVLRIDYGETAFIITGDAEYTSEYMMLDAPFPLKADVLQIGHHGSYTSSSSEFIDTVKPDFAIISCGHGNSYGHPHQETLDKLMETTLYRTDLQGTIYCESDGEHIHFSTGRESQSDLYMSPAATDEAEDIEDGTREINNIIQNLFKEGKFE